jgi:O-antigen/teichoic acid export membrane protein
MVVPAVQLSKLFSSAPVMTAARLAGAGAGFLAQLMLARLLDPKALGTFFAATSLSGVLGLLAAQGYPGVVQRFVTRYREKRRTDLVGDFVAQVQRESVIIALVFVAVLLAASLLPALDADTRLVLAATALASAAAASFSIYPALACAERRFVVGLLPETLLRPAIFLGAMAVIALTGAMLSAGTATMAYGTISVALALMQFVVVTRTLPRQGELPRKRLRARWREEGRPLVIVALFTTLFTDLVILISTPFLGAKGVAPFGVALKIAMLIGFTIQIAHQVALPEISEAYHRGDYAQLNKALLRSTIFPTLATLSAFVGTIVWGDKVLLLFGSEYAVAKWGLVIMTAAQMIRAIGGPAALLLSLSGAQRTNAAITVGCCGVLLIANAALIPHLGFMGASLSVLVVVSTWTVASGVVLWRQTKIRADVLFAVRHDLPKASISKSFV